MSAGIGTLLMVVLASGSPQFYSASEAQTLFGEGLTAYESQDYSTAQDRFRRLAEHGFGSSEVLYDLGTAHLAEGELGEAVLFLERARRADGAGSGEADAQLAVARAKQLDQVTGATTELSVIPRLVDATSARWAAATFLASWLLAFGLLSARQLAARGMRRLRGALLLTALLALCAALPAGGLLALHFQSRSSVRDGVVMTKVLPIRELPGTAGRVKFELHAGLKIRVLEREGEYVRLRLPNGLEGWAEDRGVSEI